MKKKGNHKGILDSMMLAAIFIATAYWILDSILNIFFFNKYNIIAELIGADLYNIYIRVVVLCLFVIFGSHAQASINKFRKTEKSLKEGEERYRTLFEYNPIETITVDHDARVTGYNLAKINSGDKVPQIGDIMYKDYAGKHNIDMYNELMECIKSNISKEFPEQKYNGKFLYIRIAPFSKGAIITALNTTKQKQLQTQLQQAKKMEAISTLAGGIAHQFNNILSGITGNTELLQIEYDNDKKIKEYSERLFGLTRRMTGLTSQLLAYARGGKYQERQLSVCQLVEETLPLIKHSMNRSIKVVANLEKDIPLIKADVTQLQMVFSAVMSNAAEAIEKSGTIRVAVQRKDVDDKYAAQHPGLKVGQYIRLTVEDDGKGLDNESKERIFEPFYSTKLQGRGLGMAASYGAIVNHGGWIEIDSEPDKGAVVSIYLPVSSDAEVISLRDEKEIAEISTGNETILIIDDEEEVLETSCLALEHLGYKVLTANTGMEAINIVEAASENIDLAIIDIGLPDIRGDIVCQRIQELQPKIKVVVSTGYMVEDITDDFKIKAQSFIQKPFSMSEMAMKLKQALNDK
ncbi:MAG: response regulator [Thermodesulfobacteriota bacterium]|nr:response regulator [Thermodesulfobacteriota bacterium]